MSELEMLVLGLRSRAATCTRLAGVQKSEVDRARLAGKAVAYDHAADLLNDYLSIANELEKDND